MKNSKRIILIIVALTIVLLMIFLKFMNFGIKEYNVLNIKLNAPKFSKYEDVCCMYSAEFKSFRSKYILEKELDDMVKNYALINCNNNIYFYDEKNDITITEYSVASGLLFNKFYIVFDKGNSCNTKKQMTLNDVVNLSKKGNELTFMDFEDYQYYDVGSGLIIEKFYIDDNYELLVGGFSTTPIYIKLRYFSDKSKNDYKEIEIREGNVEKFIEINKK